MKALSVLQPWAQLLVSGEKKIETRSWQTKYRGPILIHAGRRFPEAAKDLCSIDPFHSSLARHGYINWHSLPVGAIVGYATIDKCQEITKDYADEQEITFGDFRPGRFAWHIINATMLASPIQIGGKLGLFEIRDADLEQFPQLREIAQKASTYAHTYCI